MKHMLLSMRINCLHWGIVEWLQTGHSKCLHYVGSSPTAPTMVKFKYKDKLYNPVNLEKKLKKMKITVDDVELIPEEKIIEYDNSIIKHHYINSITKYTITSIYDGINKLHVKDEENWMQID